MTFKRPSPETWIALPVAAVLILTLWINAALTGSKISISWPASPWESSIVGQAWRMGQGHVSYAAPDRIPVPLMYGPLTPLVLGKIFSITGINLYAGRVLSLAASLVATGLVAWFLTRGQPRLCHVGAWIFLLGINLCTKLHFVDARPDMMALLLATVALLLMYDGYGHSRWGVYLAGVALLVAAFFFKQTVVMFSVVPLVAWSMEARRPCGPGKLGFVLLPLIVFLVVIGGLKPVAPWLYHYMVGVNAGNEIRLFRLVVRGFQLLALAPLFLVVLFDWLISGQCDLRRNPASTWLVAILLIAIPASVISAAPSGGDLNAFLPALLVMGAFCVFRMERFRAILTGPSLAFRTRFAVGILLALLVAGSTCGQLQTAVSGALLSNGDLHYLPLIRLISRRPGRTVCPQDPTIPLRAKNYDGRCFYAEKAHAIEGGEWPAIPPKPIFEEIRQADGLVTLRSCFGGFLSDQLIRDLGFEPVPVPELADSCYTLWKRRDQPP